MTTTTTASNEVVRINGAAGNAGRPPSHHPGRGSVAQDMASPAPTQVPDDEGQQ